MPFKNAEAFLSRCHTRNYVKYRQSGLNVHLAGRNDIRRLLTMHDNGLCGLDGHFNLEEMPAQPCTAKLVKSLV